MFLSSDRLNPPPASAIALRVDAGSSHAEVTSHVPVNKHRAPHEPPWPTLARHPAHVRLSDPRQFASELLFVRWRVVVVVVHLLSGRDPLATSCWDVCFPESSRSSASCPRVRGGDAGMRQWKTAPSPRWATAFNFHMCESASTHAFVCCLLLLRARSAFPPFILASRRAAL